MKEDQSQETAKTKNAPAILVIDDDIDCCTFLEKTLASLGYQVQSASTGKQGLEILNQHPFCGAFVDIFLPDKDGFEIAKSIQEEKGDSFPIVAITCTPLETLQERFPNFNKYFKDICIKPFTYGLLLEKLHLFNQAKTPKEQSLLMIIEDYRASIPNRLELLQSLVDEMRKNPRLETLKELKLQIHKLAGSAGLYGYEQVSLICKEFDERLSIKIEQFEKEKTLENLENEFENYLEKIRTGFSGAEKSISTLQRKILEKKALIGVIGLGYIGLSLLDSFGKAGFPLVGYDINAEKTRMLQNKENYLNFIDAKPLFELIDQKRFSPSSDPSILKDADVLIISVPTSIDRYGTPNLSNLRSAFQTVAQNQKKQQLIILQSSTYPGTTREELLPILQQSNLQVGIDFYLAHAPEIADIGNPNFDFMQVPRIVSGITPSCLKMVSQLYQFITRKVVPASTTEVAESAKLLQNAFRLINISFINEMKVLFDRMHIDVWDVIETAASKPFGFMPFYPSPGIGGDCIPIAPFYLVWKSKVTGGPSTMLEEAGRINSAMPHYVIGKLIEGLNLRKKTIRDSKILILGVGYKKDVNDVRESSALKILPLLHTMQAEVFYHDPYVKKIESFPEYPDFFMESIILDYKTLNLYDAVVILTDHSMYDWQSIVKNSELIIDTRNISQRVTNTEKIIKA